MHAQIIPFPAHAKTTMDMVRERLTPNLPRTSPGGAHRRVVLTKPVNLAKRATLTADERVRHGVPHDCTARHRRLVATDSPSLAEPYVRPDGPVAAARAYLFGPDWSRDVDVTVGNIQIVALADCEY